MKTKTITIRHPKAKEIFGTIKLIENEIDPSNRFEVKHSNGCIDWVFSLAYAIEEIKRSNEEEFNGSAQLQRCLDRQQQNNEFNKLNY